MPAVADDDFDVIYDRLPAAFVASIDAGLAQADAPICGYELLSRAIPKHVQRQLKDVFDEAVEAIGQLHVERFGNAVVGLDDVICAYDERDDAIYAREEAKVHRILTLWAAQAILEAGIITRALKQVDTS